MHTHKCNRIKVEKSTSKKAKIFTYGQETHTCRQEIHSLCLLCYPGAVLKVNHALNKAHHVQWLNGV